MKWLDPKNAPFLISGFPYFSQEQIYRRLSVDAQGYAPNAVDGLANETAGGVGELFGKDGAGVIAVLDLHIGSCNDSRQCSGVCVSIDHGLVVAILDGDIAAHGTD